MFLIKYSSHEYIDANKLEWLSINPEFIQFTMAGDSDTIYKVSNEFIDVFLNDIQAINGNLNSINNK